MRRSNRHKIRRLSSKKTLLSLQFGDLDALFSLRACCILLLSSLNLLLVSCIAPPEHRQASILPQKELDIITAMNEGRYYAARGRAEAAEDAYRRALALDAREGGIYNGLAYSLQQQRRYAEAEEMYRHALALSPKNIFFRENLARLLYEKGNPSAAVSEYQNVIDTYNSVKPEVLAEISGVDVPKNQLSRTYRNIAVSYYAMGRFDEAVCYSSLTVKSANDVGEAAQHARMLLSLEHVSEAAQTLRDAITAHQGNVPAGMLVDYAMVLYLSRDYGLAKAAVSRALEISSMTRADRRTAQLIKLKLAIFDKSTKDAQFTRDSLLEEDKEFCRLPNLDPNNYWPKAFSEDMNVLKDKLCNEKEQSIV